MPGGPDFSSWFAKVQEVAKRSWKSALIITGLGISVPMAVVAVIQQFAIGAWTFSVLDFDSTATAVGSLLGGFLVLLLLYVGVAFIASAAWAAGTWAIVQEAGTGQSANVGDAFRYGMSRAMRLFPWTILFGLAVGVGTACCVLPGVYAAFAFSMYGFVGVFQRGENPVGGSFQLAHSDFGPNLGKILIAFVPYVIFGYVVPLIFGIIGVAAAGAVGSSIDPGFGYNATLGIIDGIGTLIGAVGYAGMLLALLPTYAQLRARQAPTSTASLGHELNS
ncbi:hypothetical protein ACFQX7_22085 [Luedemannella flava]